MTITSELEAKILRYYYAEKWKIGTISQQLQVHHSVVRRILSQAGVPKARLISKKSIIDAYLPFIMETLSKYATLTEMPINNVGFLGAYVNAKMIENYEVRISSQSRGWNYNFMPKQGSGDIYVTSEVKMTEGGFFSVNVPMVSITSDIIFIEVVPRSSKHQEYFWPSNELKVEIPPLIFKKFVISNIVRSDNQSMIPKLN